MTTAAPSFCAVVVSYHTGPVLEACLSALIDAPLCRQVTLVDNGNSPDVVAALRERATVQPKLKLITGHGNIGFGRGCNLGASQAQDDILVFVNPDCVIDESTLPAFASTLAVNPEALIGGALRNENGSEQRGCRRGELTLWSALISFTGLARSGEGAGPWRDFNRTREPKLTEPSSVPVVSGALMAMRADQFEILGGFDPAFFLHVEDIDLCRRVRESGRTVVLDPSATALHIGATSKASNWTVERAKIASFGHYFWKNARMPWGFIAVIVTMPILAMALIVRMILTAKR